LDSGRRNHFVLWKTLWLDLCLVYNTSTTPRVVFRSPGSCGRILFGLGLACPLFWFSRYRCACDPAPRQVPTFGVRFYARPVCGAVLGAQTPKPSPFALGGGDFRRFTVPSFLVCVGGLGLNHREEEWRWFQLLVAVHNKGPFWTQLLRKGWGRSFFNFLSGLGDFGLSLFLIRAGAFCLFRGGWPGLVILSVLLGVIFWLTLFRPDKPRLPTGVCPPPSITCPALFFRRSVLRYFV